MYIRIHGKCTLGSRNPRRLHHRSKWYGRKSHGRWSRTIATGYGKRLSICPTNGFCKAWMAKKRYYRRLRCQIDQEGFRSLVEKYAVFEMYKVFFEMYTVLCEKYMVLKLTHIADSYVVNSGKYTVLKLTHKPMAKKTVYFQILRIVHIRRTYSFSRMTVKFSQKDRLLSAWGPYTFCQDRMFYSITSKTWPSLFQAYVPCYEDIEKVGGTSYSYNQMYSLSKPEILKYFHRILRFQRFFSPVFFIFFILHFYWQCKLQCKLFGTTDIDFSEMHKLHVRSNFEMSGKWTVSNVNSSV